jgi:hypothetical protein
LGRDEEPIITHGKAMCTDIVFKVHLHRLNELHGTRIPLRSWYSFSWLQNSLLLIEPEGSLLYSQEPATGC